ncbi:hypothetical protein BDQ17DRAFT_1427743 [Cyathus striatus]|nr:hypothetical protein BDQ17DRAFT_1427743 [Cyathus striatus]
MKAVGIRAPSNQQSEMLTSVVGNLEKSEILKNLLSTTTSAAIDNLEMPEIMLSIHNIVECKLPSTTEAASLIVSSDIPENPLIVPKNDTPEPLLPDQDSALVRNHTTKLSVMQLDISALKEILFKAETTLMEKEDVVSLSRYSI